MDLLSPSSVISVSWYVLESSKRPLPCLAPDIVSVLSLKVAEPVAQIFPRIRKRRGPLPDADCDDDGPEEAGDVGSGDVDLDADEAAAPLGDLDDGADPAPLLEPLLDLAEEMHAEMVAEFLDPPPPPDTLPDAPEVAFPPGPPIPPAAAEPAAAAHDEVPPPPAPYVPPVRGAIGKAECTFVVPGGVLRFYESKSSFTANCGKHPGCVLTRTNNSVFKKSKTTGVRHKAGRPVGFLGAWLAAGNDPAITDKGSHVDPKLQESLSWDMRCAFRVDAKNHPAGLELMGKEREKDDDELSEAESVGGYVTAYT